MVEMTIDSIRVSLSNYQRVVILKEKGADRYLPIWIGPAEADAIAVRLQEVSVARPLTHDLLGSVIRELGATVNFIVVTELNNDTFYAQIALVANGKQMDIDSRPSDALALAVRAGVPIYAAESVLEKAAILLDEDSGEARLPEGRAKRGVDEAELERLSAFRDFIDSLDLSDLEKKGQDKAE